ncbi:MAG: nuclear transport factor 2 family protein, partial [Chitinophagaceae bacterium]
GDDYISIHFSEPDMTLKGDAAWVRGTIDIVLNTDGKDTPIGLKVLYVFTKQDAYWKLLSRQAVR